MNIHLVHYLIQIFSGALYSYNDFIQTDIYNMDNCTSSEICDSQTIKIVITTQMDEYFKNQWNWQFKNTGLQYLSLVSIKLIAASGEELILADFITDVSGGNVTYECNENFDCNVVPVDAHLRRLTTTLNTIVQNNAVF